MRNVLTICGKELTSYFRSPIAYGVLAFFALIAGYFFYVAVSIFVQQGMQMQMRGGGFPMSVNEWVIRPVLANIAVINLFVIPMITMRLFAEEKSRGTFELLATSPIRDLEIIFGKWLAALVLYGAMLGLSLLMVGLLFVYGKPDWKPMLIGYLGLILLGGALLAIGAFISSLTRSQIVAGIATFAVLLLLWVFDWVSFETAAWAKVVSYLSVLTHFEPFSKGVVDSRDVIYFASLTFLGLFLTARSLESLRWKA
jgi:ABC-2 type transport system permease protein